MQTLPRKVALLRFYRFNLILEKRFPPGGLHSPFLKWLTEMIHASALHLLVIHSFISGVTLEAQHKQQRLCCVTGHSGTLAYIALSLKIY